MSAISSYARARAAADGHAYPIATRRHIHLAARPLVFVPLTLAGEANAPLAAMVGTDPAHPTLLTVAQPRNRDLRFRFAAELADIVLRYVESRTRDVEPAGNRLVYRDAPQMLVPNPAGVAFVRLLGRSTRFRRATGPYPVPPQVPLLGRWLTWFAERAEHPGSSALLAMTSALSLHWATGQSALEDANLAALMGWIDPTDRHTGPEAALLAEDSLVWPPAGPATDPTFDNEILAPAIRAYDSSAPDSRQRCRAEETLRRELRTQLEPTWQLMWRALDTLRLLPAGDSVEGRWTTDRREFSSYHEYVTNGGLPQARRDGAVAAARRPQTLEREQTAYDAARALDDPLVMANFRVTGEAFQGIVVEAEPTRLVVSEKGRQVLRPLITVRSEDPLRLPPQTELQAPTRPKQKGSIVRIDGPLVTLELSGGMGRGKVPPPGTVPEVGEELGYTSVFPDGIRSPDLPPPAETPWTHGGPPQPYVATDDDAREVWE